MQNIRSEFGEIYHSSWTKDDAWVKSDAAEHLHFKDIFEICLGIPWHRISMHKLLNSYFHWLTCWHYCLYSYMHVCFIVHKNFQKNFQVLHHIIFIILSSKNGIWLILLHFFLFRQLTDWFWVGFYYMQYYEFGNINYSYWFEMMCEIIWVVCR